MLLVGSRAEDEMMGLDQSYMGQEDIFVYETDKLSESDTNLQRQMHDEQCIRMNRVSYSIHHAHNGISFFKSDERARAGENKAADVFGREKSHSLENNNNPPIHHVVLFLRFTTLDLFNDFERPLLLFLLLWVWVWIRI